MHRIVSRFVEFDSCWNFPHLLTQFYSDDVDVIVFSVHAQGYKQCADQPVGTYITPVPNFLEGYLKHYQQIQQDKGYDDYELPEAAQYAYCTRTVKNGNEYWLQMGCSDGTSQKLAVNIYSDNTCTTRSTVNGYDDANIDVSEIQVGFFLLMKRRGIVQFLKCLMILL